jgi:hypothetical protein
VSEEKDPKAERAAQPAKPAVKTVVGVPALSPNGTEAGRPSRSEPPRPAAGAAPRPAFTKSIRPAPSGRDMFPGLGRAGSTGPQPPGAKPAPAMSTAVSRPPVRGAGPRHDAPPQREEAPSVEELSSSLLLADDTDETQAAGVEELSGSLLIEDSLDGEPTRVTNLSPLERPAPAYHAPLTLPDLPKSTPGPQLDPFPPAPETDPVPSRWSVDPPQIHEMGKAPEASAAPLATLPMPVLKPEHASVDAPPGEAPDRSERLPQWRTPPSEPPAPPRNLVGVAMDAIRGRLRSLSPKELLQSAGRLKERLPSAGSLTERLRRASKLKERLPNAGRLKDLLRRARGPRPAWLLPAVTMGGLVLGIGGAALLYSVAHSPSREENAEAPSARASSSAAVAPAPPQAPAASQSSGWVAAPPAACTVTGPPHVVAPSAILSAGVEVRRVGDAMALGFAPDDHHATAVRLDPTSLAASTAAKARSADPIRRVLPIASANGALDLAVDVDRKKDPLQGRRTIPLPTPLQLGWANDTIAWARMGGSTANKLWRLDGEGDVEALRGAVEAVEARTTVAIAFRRSNAIWMGAATGSSALTPQGELSHVDGLGPSVGSPAIAMNDGVVLVAWSDRASPDDPWHLRWTRFKAGEVPTEPKTFAPPAGGKGEQAMSPGIAAIPGKRFLLIWTEGPITRHDVRGLTLAEDGTPIGAPLTISSESGNAGQGQAAVTSDGSGVVAFLESSESAEGGFRLAATPISCGM